MDEGTGLREAGWLRTGGQGSHPAGLGRFLSQPGEPLHHVGPASGRAGAAVPGPHGGSHPEGESCNQSVIGKMAPEDEKYLKEQRAGW